MTKYTSVATTIQVTVSGGSTLSASQQSISVKSGSTSSITINTSNPYGLSYSWSSTGIADYTANNQTSSSVRLNITGKTAGNTTLTVTDPNSGKAKIGRAHV